MPSPSQIGAVQRQRIYAYLCEVAARAGPMPSNAEFQAAAGFGWEIHKRLKRLAESGLISVEYRANGRGSQRRCIILATGDRTAWSGVPASKGGAGNRPITGKYPLLASRGMSDFTIYGHLAEAVRACRRAGDVVHRSERWPDEILINGRPGDVKARAKWHASRSQVRPANQQFIHSP